MSWEVYEDECPGCRPVLINPETGKVIPDSAPEMQAVLRTWRQTTRDERLVFHRVTCLNSTSATDMQAMHLLMQRMQFAMGQTIH